MGGRPQYCSSAFRGGWVWNLVGWFGGMVLAHCWGSEGSHDSSPRGPVRGCGGASFAEAAPVGVVGVLVGVVFGC
jgi:hypothetical protein